MNKEWEWRYVPPAKVYNPEETWPGFYQIWNGESIIAHIELPIDAFYSSLMRGICDNYNRLKEEEAKALAQVGDGR